MILKQAANGSDHLERLKELTVNKSNLGPSEKWSHRQEYECLRELILQDTGVLLSTNTLKRLFGKISSKSAPGKSTLNTLALFCGYKSYVDLIQSDPGQGAGDGLNHSKMYHKKTRLRIISGAAIFLVLLASFIVIRKANYRRMMDETKIVQVFEKGSVPFTQIYRYHVNSSALDTIYFQELDRNRIALSTRDSIFNWVHFVPGYRSVRFFAKEEVIWESEYKVNSDGWLFIFPWGSVEPRKYISLNNSDGEMGVSREMLEENHIDLDDDGGWVQYFNMRDFQTPGSAFAFESRIKNELAQGAQQCQDAIINLECEHMIFSVHFTQKGCQKFAELTIGDDYYDGERHDLTRLTLDLSQWQNISITVRDQVYSVYLDDQLLIEKPFSQIPGDLSGIHYSFRGLGKVDDIQVYDLSGALKYSEDFQ